MNIVNAVIQGILLGGLYALFACGLSLIFGVMRIINLAHGDLAVLGAFLVWSLSTQAGLSPLRSGGNRHQQNHQPQCCSVSHVLPLASAVRCQSIYTIERSR